MAALVRRLGTRDAALIVMGGIIGSGIFRNPSVVAKQLHNGPLIVLACIDQGLPEDTDAELSEAKLLANVVATEESCDQI